MTEAPPRRLSIHDEDWDPAVSSKLDILLDGELQNEVISYNTDEGWLVRNVTKDGQLVIDPDTHRLVREKVEGKVEVRWQP